MNDLIPILIIIGSIAVSIGGFIVAIKSGKKKIETLKETAERLGLIFTQEGKYWFTKWEINGNYNATKIKIGTVTYGTGKNRRTYTKIQAFFKENLNIGLNIYKENIFSKIGTVFGAQDIKIGNEEFDKKFTIKAKNEQIVTTLLQNPAIQQAIIDLFNKENRAVVDDEGINVEKNSLMTDENTYREILNELTTAIKIFKK